MRSCLGAVVGSLLAMSISACSSGGGADGGTGSIFTGNGGSSGASSAASGTAGSGSSSSGSASGSPSAGSPSSSASGSPSAGSTGSASATGGMGPPGSWDSGCAYPDGGNPANGEGVACTGNAMCNCPFVCTMEPAFAATVCTQPCTTSADCEVVEKSCQGGQCLYNQCNFDGGSVAAPDSCDVTAGAHDGVCSPFLNGATMMTVGLCVLAGGSTQSCDNSRAGLRGDSGTDECQLGYICNTDPNTGMGVCAGICDSSVDGGGTCAGTAMACVAGPLGFGSCVPEGLGGCVTQDPSPHQGGPCTRRSDCDCPEECTFNPLAGASFCELKCGATTGSFGCPFSYQVCIDGGCAQDFCQVNPLGGAVPGAFGQSCSTAKANDGTCTPEIYTDSTGTPIPLADGGLNWYGLCFQNGTSATTGPCDPNVRRDGGTGSSCVAGDFCEQDPATLAQECLTPCTWVPVPPASDGGVDGGSDAGIDGGSDAGVDAGPTPVVCGAGLGCFDLTGSTGYCATCTPPTQGSQVSPCASNGECCSGVCLAFGTSGAHFCQ